MPDFGLYDFVEYTTSPFTPFKRTINGNWKQTAGIVLAMNMEDGKASVLWLDEHYQGVELVTSTNFYNLQLLAKCYEQNNETKPQVGDIIYAHNTTIKERFYYVLVGIEMFDEIKVCRVFSLVAGRILTITPHYSMMHKKSLKIPREEN